MASGWPPKRGVAFTFTIIIRDADGDGIADPAGLSAKISKDDGAEASLTATPTVVSAGSKMVKVSVGATEATADHVAIVVSSTSTGAKDAFATIFLETNQIRETYSRIGAPSGVSIASDLLVIDDFLDTEIAAILTDTGTTLDNHLTDLKGTGFVKDTHSLKNILDDTNVLQSDWADGGRLDLILDIIAADVINMDGSSIPSVASIADAVFDELMADHLVDGSFGLALNALDAGTASAGAAGTITLDAGSASTVADLYNGAKIKLVSGTGAGQSRRMTDYAVTSRIASIEPNWITIPDATTKYVVVPGGNADLRTATQTSISSVDTDWADGGRLDLLLDALQADLDNGTDGLGALKALIDTVNTDLSNPTDGLGALKALIDVVDDFVDTEITDIQNRLPAALSGGGNIKSDVLAINGSTAAAVNLALASAGMVTGTVHNAVAPTTTIFECDDITTAAPDHYNGRLILFTSGVLLRQLTNVLDYRLLAGRGEFTVTAVTSAPVNDNTLIVI